jgi:hypothetical protein
MATPFSQTIVRDTFTRANSGTLGANWTANSDAITTGTIGIVSNSAQSVTGIGTGNAASFYNAATFLPNQYSECILNGSALGTNTHLVGPTVRGSAAGYYRFTGNMSNTAANVQLAKVVGGSFTSLASTSITLALGDLFRLEAIGTQLTAYWNGTQVFQVTDSDLPTGAPGIASFMAAASPTAFTQSWEGGDLLWTRQGVVIPTGTHGGSQEPSVTYEANPKILTANADGKIFKMWFMNGWNSGTVNIYYAESNDGITWTQYVSNPVITDGANNVGHGSVTHIGNTYYGYFINDVYTNTAIVRWTSSDGITWTKTGTVLSAGAGGAWDATVFNPKVWVDGAGLWNMMYEGTPATAYSTGLATSPDGITWTKFAGDPLMTMGSGSADAGKTAPIYDGSTDYYIGHGSPSSNLPSDLYLWSAPAITGAWAQSSKNPIYERVTADEGANLPLAGQIADPSLVEVNGTSYLFYDATSVQAAGHFVIKVATAPYTILQLMGMIFGANIIYGNVGIAGATINYSGTASGSVFSDVNGNYVIPVQSNGTYTITPSFGVAIFTPTSQIAVVNNADVTPGNFPTPLNFYSVPDDRTFSVFPNASENVQGTLIYDVPAQPSTTAPVDSRVSKPVDSRTSANIPTNSRTPGTFGPGE